MQNAKRQLLIEGWRFLPQSYALVNQYQILEFLKRPDVEIAHRDMPFLSTWQSQMGIFPPKQEKRLESLPPPDLGKRYDAVLRVCFPLDLAASRQADRTVIFGTSEFLNVDRSYLAAGITLAEAHRNSPAVIVTSSDWSRQGFLNSGAVADRVVTIPLGVDEKLFAPCDEEERRLMRSAYGWDGFIFLTVGSAAGNKGLDVLLKAFAVIAQWHPRVRLVIKGLDQIFDSRRLFEETKAKLTQEQITLIEPRVNYWGGIASQADLAKTYNLVDAYVAPYRAEGFAMPVLEAAASGLPVICTRGGSTEDFIHDDFALRIQSKTSSGVRDGERWTQLEPDVDHLIELMKQVVMDADFRRRARAAGPRFVRENFTWRQTVDKLMRVLFP